MLTELVVCPRAAACGEPVCAGSGGGEHSAGARHCYNAVRIWRRLQRLVLPTLYAAQRQQP